jgi:hypothetical protein
LEEEYIVRLPIGRKVYDAIEKTEATGKPKWDRVVGVVCAIVHPIPKTSVAPA